VANRAVVTFGPTRVTFGSRGGRPKAIDKITPCVEQETDLPPGLRQAMGGLDQAARDRGRRLTHIAFPFREDLEPQKLLQEICQSVDASTLMGLRKIRSITVCQHQQPPVEMSITEGPAEHLPASSHFSFRAGTRRVVTLSRAGLARQLLVRPEFDRRPFCVQQNASA
jgi:hypothetical protein